MSGASDTPDALVGGFYPGQPQGPPPSAADHTAGAASLEDARERLQRAVLGDAALRMAYRMLKTIATPIAAAQGVPLGVVFAALEATAGAGEGV